MGDRVSISFKNRDEESVTLFDHWGGRERVEHAAMYAADLIEKEKTHPKGDPLGRLEPDTVMVDYLCKITPERAKAGRIRGLYLQPTPNDGDNSDNRHFTIDLAAGGKIIGPDW